MDVAGGTVGICKLPTCMSPSDHTAYEIESLDIVSSQFCRVYAAAPTYGAVGSHLPCVVPSPMFLELMGARARTAADQQLGREEGGGEGLSPRSYQASCLGNRRRGSSRGRESFICSGTPRIYHINPSHENTLKV
jgi:hypothetical protein